MKRVNANWPILKATWAVLIVAVWLLHRALLRSEAATLRASQDPLHPAEAPRDRTRDPDAV